MSRGMMVLTLLLTTGCVDEEAWSIAGLWMFQVELSDASDCTTALEHNFTNAFSPDAVASDWTVVDDAQYSDSVLFAQISLFDDTSGVLVVNNATYPGAMAEDGSWLFSWTGTDDITHTEDHESNDYTFTAFQGASSTFAWLLNFDPAARSGTGSLQTSYQSDDIWMESDEWDAETVGLSIGKIPSSLYLVYTETDTELAQVNRADVRDCNDSECELSLSTTCPVVVQNINGWWVEPDDADVYDGVSGAMQPYGSAI